MHVAIVGSGVAGLSTAWLLHRAGHQVTVFEAGSHIGGHVNTIPVEAGGQTWPVDTGFIVFNHRTYPHFTHLLAHLGVDSRPTTMSFSVRDDRAGLEYNGHTFNTLFAQRRNFLRPSHWSMIRDILRFNREARSLLDAPEDVTIGSFLEQGGYRAPFLERYLVPMAAAIWSSPAAAVQHMPARFFARFFHNHGFLEIDDRPVWRTVVGGSWSYLLPLVSAFREHILLNTPVQAILRHHDRVEIHSRRGVGRFDQVVLACHSDQALGLLRDASAQERDILGQLPYQTNEAVLHTDISVLPRRRACWAGWNYRLDGRQADSPVPVTYQMNLLQGFTAAPCQFLVTLNSDAHIDPQKVLRRIAYQHPQYGPTALRAQGRWSEINGVNRTWFSGAYWRYGFHEDGLVSGLRVAAGLGCTPPWQTEMSASEATMADGVG